MIRLINYKRFLMFAIVLIIPIMLQLVGTAEPVDESTGIVVEEEEETEDIDKAEEKPQISENPRVALMNSVELYPTDPQSEDLDILLDSIMDDIINDDMTTYEKAKVSYDYLVANVRYGSHSGKLGTKVGSVTCSQIYSSYGDIEGYGAVVLSSNVGMCNAYSSAYILMAREIGLEAKLVKGSTKGAGGGYVQHQWVEIIIDGSAYIFDPQLEQNLTAAGLGTYNVFFKTYDQVPGRYIKYA